jgi:DnaB-like helicase C terminal domain/Toprim-like
LSSSTINPLSPVYITEGEFDAAIFEQADMRAVSFPSATYKLPANLKDQLLEADSVILAGDSDPQGQELMQRLWADLQERTYLLQWPPGIKDANQFFLEFCKRDIDKFKKEIDKLVSVAKTTPIPYIYSLQESLMNINQTNLADHPKRLRFPWKNVDRMAILLPGSVTVITTTNTKMGKTCFTKDVSVHNAFLGSPVLNYGAELSIDEFKNLVAAGVLKRDRNHLTQKDGEEASKLLSGIKYYYGNNPTLTTIGPVLDLIESAVRRLSIEVLILDHIHFYTSTSRDSTSIESEAMQRLKLMAGKYQLKVIVVAQPRKSKQENKGRELHVTDVKGSEALASSADAVFSLHRNYVKIIDPDNPPMDAYDPQTRVTLLGVRSKGDGPASCELMFVGKYASFVEVSYQQPPPGVDKMF